MTPPAPESVPDALKPALSHSSALCTSILAELASPFSAAAASPPPPAQDPPAASTADVRNDFVEIVTFLGRESTALSLSFKPPVSAPAATGTLEKIDGLLTKLAYCLKVAPTAGALAKELNWAAQETVEAVQRLLDGSLAAYEAEGKRAKELREVNLRFTALVWEKAEQAKQLSEDELQASRRSWKNVLGLLDDCLEEVKEMEESEPAGMDSDDEGEGDSDDEDDDFRASHPLSDAERARVSAAHILLRIGRLLLHRLITSTAPELAPATPGYAAPAFLETTARLVLDLSAVADDFAASLEPPQTDALEDAAKFGATGIALSEAVEGAVEGSKGAEAESKWQGMWRSQVRKLQYLGRGQEAP